MKATYAEKFKDPRWQRKRLEILSRDAWACKICGDKENTLHVHHKIYLSGKEPWDYADCVYVTLCQDCHQKETEEMPRNIECLILQLKIEYFSDEIFELAEGMAIKRASSVVPQEEPVVGKDALY